MVPFVISNRVSVSQSRSRAVSTHALLSPDAMCYTERKCIRKNHFSISKSDRSIDRATPVYGSIRVLRFYDPVTGPEPGINFPVKYNSRIFAASSSAHFSTPIIFMRQRLYSFILWGYLLAPSAAGWSLGQGKSLHSKQNFTPLLHSRGYHRNPSATGSPSAPGNRCRRPSPDPD